MGFAIDDVVGKTDFDLFAGAFAERIRELKLRAMTMREVVRETVKLVNSEASETHDLSIRPVLDDENSEPIGVACVSMHLPDYQMTLADEANHRIKNSLLLAQALLRMQRRRSTSGDVQAALVEAEGQINSIAQMHGKLAEGGINGKVAFRDYLNSVCANLLETFAEKDQLQIEADVSDIDLDGQVALKLALMTSELVMNSVKHAMQEQEPLVVRVIFHPEDSGYLLAIEDNGKGLPDDFDPLIDSGVGMRILQTLARDLSSSMRIERQGKGARFVFDIPRL